MNTSDLLFIEDISLRHKIEESIETSSMLYLMQKDGKFSSVVALEVRRIIILYVASIIEALLLYFYKKKGFSSTKIEYSKVRSLPQDYQSSVMSTVVIATQIQRPRDERELMLDVLVKFLEEEKIIHALLAQKIIKIKDIRNTFHLSKSREGIECSNEAVDEANEVLLEIIIVVCNKFY